MIRPWKLRGIGIPRVENGHGGINSPGSLSFLSSLVPPCHSPTRTTSPDVYFKYLNASLSVQTSLRLAKRNIHGWLGKTSHFSLFLSFFLAKNLSRSDPPLDLSQSLKIRTLTPLSRWQLVRGP